MDSLPKFLQNLIFSAKKLKNLEFFFFPLLLLPLCGVVGYLHIKNLRLKELSQTVELLEKKATLLQQRKDKQEERWALVKKSSPNELQQTLEAIPLLTAEQQRVQALAKQYPGNPAIQDRLSFLKGDKNRIRLIKGEERLQEREYSLQNPVQMNTEDLKNFLSALEAKTQLIIIKTFDLKKHQDKTDEIVYTVQAELIQKSP